MTKLDITLKIAQQAGVVAQRISQYGLSSCVRPR